MADVLLASRRPFMPFGIDCVDPLRGSVAVPCAWRKSTACWRYEPGRARCSSSPPSGSVDTAVRAARGMGMGHRRSFVVLQFPTRFVLFR